MMMLGQEYMNAGDLQTGMAVMEMAAAFAQEMASQMYSANPATGNLMQQTAEQEQQARAQQQQQQVIEREQEQQQVARVEPEVRPEGSSYEEKLGARVQELSEDMIAADRRLGDEHQGLVITEVDQSGAGRRAGLIAVDPRRGFLPIITHVNGERVRTGEDLRRATADVGAGDVISLRLFEIIEDQARTRVVRYRAGGQ